MVEAFLLALGATLVALYGHARKAARDIRRNRRACPVRNRRHIVLIRTE